MTKYATTFTEAENLVKASIYLMEQIDKGNLKDDNGHDFTMNDAYLKMKSLLTTITTETP